MKNSISFSSEGVKVVGNLILPESHKEGQKLPAVVVVTPAGGVKEQTAGIYAQKLADKGFITLAFDHRTFGESEGEPRIYENPYMKVEDIKNAVSFLGTLPEVDKEQIGSLAICSGTGYLAHAVATDRRIKAFASVSGVFDQRETLLALLGKEVVLNLLVMAGQGRQQYYETGEVSRYEQISTNIVEDTNQFQKEAFDYYCTARGSCATWSNDAAIMSYDQLMSFSGFDVAKLISPTPVLSIIGSNAMTAISSTQMFELLDGSKELFTIEGATHIDLYDKAVYVNQAVEKLADFFKEFLS